jgi:hypothetical protein
VIDIYRRNRRADAGLQPLGQCQSKWGLARSSEHLQLIRMLEAWVRSDNCYI